MAKKLRICGARPECELPFSHQPEKITPQLSKCCNRSRGSSHEPKPQPSIGTFHGFQPHEVLSARSTFHQMRLKEKRCSRGASAGKGNPHLTRQRVHFRATNGPMKNHAPKRGLRVAPCGSGAVQKTTTCGLQDRKPSAPAQSVKGTQPPRYPFRFRGGDQRRRTDGHPSLQATEALAPADASASPSADCSALWSAGAAASPKLDVTALNQPTGSETNMFMLGYPRRYMMVNGCGQVENKRSI